MRLNVQQRDDIRVGSPPSGTAIAYNCQERAGVWVAAVRDRRADWTLLEVCDYGQTSGLRPGNEVRCRRAHRHSIPGHSFGVTPSGAFISIDTLFMARSVCPLLDTAGGFLGNSYVTAELEAMFRFLPWDDKGSGEYHCFAVPSTFPSRLTDGLDLEDRSAADGKIGRSTRRSQSPMLYWSRRRREAQPLRLLSHPPEHHDARMRYQGLWQHRP